MQLLADSILQLWNIQGPELEARRDGVGNMCASSAVLVFVAEPDGRLALSSPNCDHICMERGRNHVVAAALHADVIAIRGRQSQSAVRLRDENQYGSIRTHISKSVKSSLHFRSLHTPHLQDAVREELEALRVLLGHRQRTQYRDPNTKVYVFGRKS